MLHYLSQLASCLSLILFLHFPFFSIPLCISFSISSLFGAAERCQIIRVCAALTHHHRAGVFWGFLLFSLWRFVGVLLLSFFGGECRIYLENCWLVSFAVGQQLEQNKNRLEEQQKVHADSLAFEMAQLFPTRRVTLLWQFSVVLFKSVRVYIFLWETRRDLAGDRYSIISLSLSHTARHMKPMCPAIDTIVTVCPMPLFLDVLYTHKLFLMYLTFIDSIAIRWPMTIWNRRRPKGGEG